MINSLFSNNSSVFIMKIFRSVAILFWVMIAFCLLIGCDSQDQPSEAAENKIVKVQRGDLTVDILASGNPKLIAKYEDFKPLPNTEKLGPASGAFVDKYIWDDLNQMADVRNKYLKFYDTVLTLWKTGKVVFNPAAHFRNIYTNVLFNSLSGLHPWRLDIYTKAAKEMRNNGQFYKEAKGLGLLDVFSPRVPRIHP